MSGIVEKRGGGGGEWVVWEGLGESRSSRGVFEGSRGSQGLFGGLWG